MKVRQHVKCWEHGSIFLLHPQDKTEVYEKPESRGGPTCFHTALLHSGRRMFRAWLAQGPAKWGGWGREGGDIHTLFLSTYLERPKNQLHNLLIRDSLHRLNGSIAS